MPGSSRDGLRNASRPQDLVGVAAVVAVVLTLLCAGSVLLRDPEPTAPGAAVDGAAGIGDLYFPDAGNGGYDVAHYEVDLDWDPATTTLRGTTTLTLTPTVALRSFVLDLALEVSAVRVDGVGATVRRQGFSDLRVTPATALPAGSPVEVAVDYGGRPSRVRDGEPPPVYQVRDETVFDETVIAGEPQAAAWWFPANDHPSDPATMTLTVRVPDGVEAVGAGRLVSPDVADEADHDSWRWSVEEPTPTYTTFLAVGQYTLEESEVDGRQVVYAVSDQLTGDRRTAALTALRRTPETIRRLETLFGLYPSNAAGGLATVAALPFEALETQGRPVYQADALADPEFGRTVVTHELAHVWFGNRVTLARWADIVNSEGWASWAEWAVAEQTGGRSAAATFDFADQRFRGEPDLWRIDLTDPGTDHLFDAVYRRGPMALQALRTVLGDDAFLALARDWAQTPGSRSLDDFRSAAQARTTTDLAPFFETWYAADEPPAQTAALGYR